ncbi:MAG: endonuclease MutS2 [Veillonellaceae bacterium]|jgi:DNA mismatch repair protein MutS2|nr:endonuclease MutS2 [Veillonellaceae bacterium]
MDPAALKTLEYSKIIGRLAEYTSTIRGRELAERLQPVAEPERVVAELDLTTDAVAVLRQNGAVPFGGIRDLRQILGRARVGGGLSGEELLAVGSTLRAARLMKAFFADLADPAPALQGWAVGLSILRATEFAIEKAIDDNGTVRDEASDKLAQVRREIRSLQGRVKDKLDSILRSSQYRTFFQDALYTMRGDRYVIPIKQEYRHQFPGILHDQSASGATVYIEPMALVNLNNDLKGLLSTEQTEVEKILLALSVHVAAQADAIEANCDILAQLDFVFAKARLALDMRGVRPFFAAPGRVSLRQARHPLIATAAVVPIDIEIGGEFDTLLITGPNTGGKTVALKTLGLLTLMLQSGLFVPAAPESEMAVFANVFADIGDEQSIEQSLSTFSGHMTNLVRILSQVAPNCLVLIDEIGAGTDPEEGTALAMSILEHLHAQGIRTVATTHYGELKAFAYTHPGVANASVEFDLETLRPTYRLLIGVAGSSNAFAVSQRLGLSAEIVERARALTGGEHQKFETVLSAMEEHKRASEREREEAAALRQESLRLRQTIEKEKQLWENKKRDILGKARADADELMRQTRLEAEEVIKDLKQHFSLANHVDLQSSIEGARRKIRDKISELNPLTAPAEEPIFATGEQARLIRGAVVWVENLGQQGTILEVGNESATVQLGVLKTMVPVAQCRVLKKSAQKKSPARTVAVKSSSFERPAEVAREIDIRGLNNEEAAYVLDKYIDDAVMAGLDSVSVIHGKGTGALRKGVRAYLMAHPRVKSVSIGEINQGGTGVSVAKLS